MSLVGWTLHAQPLPRPELFNYGRTRSFRGASETADGRQLFVTVRGPDRNAASAFRDHVATLRYENGRWTDAIPLRLFAHASSDRDPVISPDGRRLYFSSNAVPSGVTEESGSRVWYVDRTPDGWSAPVYAGSLNVRFETSVTAIATDGTLYLTAGDTDGCQLLRRLSGESDREWLHPAHRGDGVEFLGQRSVGGGGSGAGVRDPRAFARHRLLGDARVGARPRRPLVVAASTRVRRCDLASTVRLSISVRRPRSVGTLAHVGDSTVSAADARTADAANVTGWSRTPSGDGAPSRTRPRARRARAVPPGGPAHHQRDLVHT